MNMSIAHEEFYRQALYYDIAFSYRDVPCQVDFLEACFHRHAGRPLQAVLELACGPGYHILEFARRGYRAVGLDLRPEMIAYLDQRASHLHLPVELIVGDMRDFNLDQPVDLAINLVTAISYLLTNEDIVSHLQTVARNLTEGGLYIIEANHPRDYFSGIQFRPIRWTMEREGIVVETTWGGEDPHLDLATEVYTMEASYRVRDNGREFFLHDQGLLRLLLPQELRALVALSGAFVPVGWYGDFDLAQPFDASERSWRTIVVLQKSP